MFDKHKAFLGSLIAQFHAFVIELRLFNLITYFRTNSEYFISRTFCINFIITTDPLIREVGWTSPQQRWYSTCGSYLIKFPINYHVMCILQECVWVLKIQLGVLILELTNLFSSGLCFVIATCVISRTCVEFTTRTFANFLDCRVVLTIVVVVYNLWVNFEGFGNLFSLANFFSVKIWMPINMS